MKSDSVRLWASSIVAIALVLGGLYAVYQMAQARLITGGEALAVIGPLIGVAAAWALGRDAATQGARSFEAGVTKGANAQPMTSTTTTAEGTATATTTPSSLTDTDA